MIDLLVAGGGPAGLGTAIQAALAGLSVVVAEPRPAPIDKACGEGLMPAAVRALEDLGVEVAGRPFRGIRYIEGRRHAEAAFRVGPGLGVRRTDLHAALSRRAAGLGIEVVPRRVDGIERLADGDGVRAAGMTARYLAAADGLHSPIRRSLGLQRPDPAPARYGLRRHFRVPAWSEFVEVHWSGSAEAYVTPLASGLTGVAVLTSKRATFDEHLAGLPELAERLSAATPVTAVRGAGPLRQRVRRRVAGRVLLVGDAAGYVDALTGEGIAVSLAAGAELVRCVRADRPEDYERAWRKVSRTYRTITGSLLWARRQPLLAPRVVPAAARLPRIFEAAVNRLA